MTLTICKKSKRPVCPTGWPGGFAKEQKADLQNEQTADLQKEQNADLQNEQKADLQKD